jgi:hypothetical protein
METHRHGEKEAGATMSRDAGDPRRSPVRAPPDSLRRRRRRPHKTTTVVHFPLSCAPSLFVECSLPKCGLRKRTRTDNSHHSYLDTDMTALA